MALRDHLRPQQDRAVGVAEAPQRLGELLGLLDRVRVEPDQLELRNTRGQLALEPLRAGADPRELDRPALRAVLRQRLRVPAMVAAHGLVAVENERDVAVRTSERRPARAAVERGSDTAAVQEQDRLPAALRDPPELGQQ